MGAASIAFLGFYCFFAFFMTFMAVGEVFSSSPWFYWSFLANGMFNLCAAGVTTTSFDCMRARCGKAALPTRRRLRLLWLLFRAVMVAMGCAFILGIGFSSSIEANSLADFSELNLFDGSQGTVALGASWLMCGLCFTPGVRAHIVRWLGQLGNKHGERKWGSIAVHVVAYLAADCAASIPIAFSDQRK